MPFSLRGSSSALGRKEFLESLVHLVLGDPQRQFGGLDGEVSQFYAVEVGELDASKVAPSRMTASNLVESLEYLHLQAAQSSTRKLPG
jgi:hypothetical protein